MVPGRWHAERPSANGAVFVLWVAPRDATLVGVFVNVTANPLNVWANIGDSGASSGIYKSTDGGVTFARVAAFGAIRLTPAVPVSAGILWLSDQFRMAETWSGWSGNYEASGPVAAPLAVERRRLRHDAGKGR